MGTEMNSLLSGQIHHIKTGHLRFNQEADAIFGDYQMQASTGKLPFRRWPLRAVSITNLQEEVV